MSQALTSNTDAVSAVEQVEKKGGNDGVTWVGVIEQEVPARSQSALSVTSPKRVTTC